MKPLFVPPGDLKNLADGGIEIVPRTGCSQGSTALSQVDWWKSENYKNIPYGPKRLIGKHDWGMLTKGSAVPSQTMFGTIGIV